MTTHSRPPLTNAILLTGAGRRLGLYHAERLLDAGQPLIITYRTPRPSIERLQQRGARAIRADLSTPEGIEDLVAAIFEHASSLRAIIHNASIWMTDEQLEQDPSCFDTLFNVHVRAPYRINIACEPLLAACTQPFADIIHMTDTGVQKGSARRSAYIASKAALNNLSKSFAARLAPKVKVNSIAPGLIMFNEGDSEAYRKDRLARSVLGYEPGPDVVWQAICCLMENPFITGASIPVDGGRNVR